MPRYSTEESSRVSTYGGLLPRVTDRIIPARTLPRFHWPSERHLVPTDCQRNHCGGSLWINIPTADQRVTDVTCSLCTRVMCELISDNAPSPMTADLKAQPDFRPRIGRPPKPVDPNRLSDNQRAYRERLAAGLVKRQRWATDHDVRVACGKAEYPHAGHGRCLKCRDRSKERQASRARRVLP